MQVFKAYLVVESMDMDLDGDESNYDELHRDELVMSYDFDQVTELHNWIYQEIKAIMESDGIIDEANVAFATAEMEEDYV